MLLNEFLKEHRKVQEQDRKDRRTRSQDRATAKRFSVEIREQEKQIAALTSGLQKVSARILVSKPERRWPPNNY